MAERFFAQHYIPYKERDVTKDARFMQELEKLAGSFITPTLWVDATNQNWLWSENVAVKQLL
jgi:glutaredoxin